MGYSGSGKSTLAVILGQKYNIPVLHLDATFWYGDWQSRSRKEQQEEVGKFLSENEEWVIDGNYFKISPGRFADCDKLFFLNYNRFYCYRQACRRYKKYKGSVRPDCPCPEKFDAEFKSWLLKQGRTRERKQKYREIIADCKGEVLEFRSRKKLMRYLKSLN